MDMNSGSHGQWGELEAALTDPAFYPHHVESIQVEETHISKVYLTGSFVYKLKKAVNFGFLDFSTLEKRRHWCEQELLLNQRLSHSVYLGVVTITREPGGLALNGPGEPVEYAVKMRQLPSGRCMLGLLRKGELTLSMVQDLAHVLARFYEKARRGPEVDRLGSIEVIESNTEENFSQTEPFVPELLARDKYLVVREAVRDFLRRHPELFQRRIKAGRIRDCHGDLRLDHVYFLDGIEIIDCIEFNDRLRYGDITGDLAFLAMGLDFRGHQDLSWALINTYAQEAQDPEVYILLDFYKCYRACVRCKVESLRLAEGGLPPEEAHAVAERARQYFDLAHGYAATFGRLTLWVVCGLSASGKTTIANELAKRLQVKVHCSDVLRKRLFGIDPQESAVIDFGEGIYVPAATSQTYENLLEAARRDLSAGSSSILDATFSRRAHRSQVRQLATELGVNLIMVECLCPPPLLRQRLAGRNGEAMVTDARLQHLEAQLRAFEPLDELEKDVHLQVRTDEPLEQSLEQLFSAAYLCQIQQAKGTAQILGRR
jgi:aminoglycoside phosphotransferase family enzyme/predicted kinase